MIIVQAITYIAIAVFVIGLIYRIVKYAHTPLHVRWEIYPVPGEVGAEHGGSRFEQVDWWIKPPRKSGFAELRAMLTEILLVHSLWRHNRRLWFVSYPFHGGIYLTVAFVVLLFLGAIAEGFGGIVSNSIDGWGALLAYLTIVVGVLGFVAVVIGALGLLFRRLFNREVRASSTLGDYFNLLFILAIAASALFAWASADTDFALLRDYLRSIFSLRVATSAARPAVMLELVLLSLFLLYLPFTHMMHFVAKYFTYHMVRWDDHPNPRGGALEKRVGVNLNRPIDWSSEHIGAGSSWAEVALSEPGSPAQPNPAATPAKEVL